MACFFALEQNIPLILSLATTQCSLCLQLQKTRLIFKDAQCLFEASNFCSATGNTLFVCLWLCNAPVLNAFQVLQHSIQLLLNARFVGCSFCSCFVEASCFLSFVLDVLLFCDFLNFILFGLLVIRCRSGFFSRCHFNEPLGKIGLHNLQQANDASTTPLI